MLFFAFFLIVGDAFIIARTARRLRAARDAVLSLTYRDDLRLKISRRRDTISPGETKSGRQARTRYRSIHVHAQTADQQTSQLLLVSRALCRSFVVIRYIVVETSVWVGLTFVYSFCGSMRPQTDATLCPSFFGQDREITGRIDAHNDLL